jgi:hypothetical protein
MGLKKTGSKGLVIFSGGRADQKFFKNTSRRLVLNWDPYEFLKPHFL